MSVNLGVYRILGEGSPVMRVQSVCLELRECVCVRAFSLLPWVSPMALCL